MSDEEAERLVSRRRERIVMMICKSSRARVDDWCLLLCVEFFYPFVCIKKLFLLSKVYALPYYRPFVCDLMIHSLTNSLSVANCGYWFLKCLIIYVFLTCCFVHGSVFFLFFFSFCLFLFFSFCFLIRLYNIIVVCLCFSPLYIITKWWWEIIKFDRTDLAWRWWSFLTFLECPRRVSSPRRKLCNFRASSSSPLPPPVSSRLPFLLWASVVAV